MIERCGHVQERKTVEGDVATPASVLSIADFITPVRPKLLAKLPIRKVVEVNLHETFGQPLTPFASNSCQK